MLLYYLRHGDPIYDPNSLTLLGRRQAEALGRRLSQHGLDRIYVSSSQRAKETASPTCEMLHMDYVELDWANEEHAWNEFAVENLDGKKDFPAGIEKYERLMASYEMQKLGREWGQHPVLKGTRLETARIRVALETDNFLASLGYQHDWEKGGYYCSHVNRERIAFFAHYGFGMAFLSSILDIPYPVFCTRFNIAHSSMTVISFPEKEGFVIPRLLQLSSDSHLYKEGLPTFYNNEILI